MGRFLIPAVIFVLLPLFPVAPKYVNVYRRNGTLVYYITWQEFSIGMSGGPSDLSAIR